MRKVACVGVGNVGRAWSIVFAKAGYEVRLFDANSDVVRQQSLPSIVQSLEDLEAAGLVDSAAQTLARIRVVETLADAVDGVDYVQESIAEDLELKRGLYSQLAQTCSRSTILASSTSAIPGSKFMLDVVAPERCIVVHPVNPPYLIPLVEICASPKTSAKTVADCRAMMIETGQQPITINKEIPGFVLNRLQFTLLAEALHLVGEGYCSAEDVDKALKHGLAMRWAFMGPFEVGHLNSTAGFQGYVDSLGAMMRDLAHDARTDYEWGAELAGRIHQTLCETTPVGDVPDRQAWRDRRIMALRQHLDDAEKTLC